MIDTAEIYGDNESFIGTHLKERRKEFTLATKFGIKTDKSHGLDASPATAHISCEGSLKRLQTEVIDLYYLHRVDPNTPIEETVGAMQYSFGKRSTELCEEIETLNLLSSKVQGLRYHESMMKNVNI